MRSSRRVAYVLGSFYADSGEAQIVRRRWSDDQPGNLENKNAIREGRGRGPGKSPSRSAVILQQGGSVLLRRAAHGKVGRD